MFESTATNIQRYYKSYFSAYVKFIFLLTAIGFIERCFFAIYHRHIAAQLSFTEILYALVWGIRFDLALAGFLALVLFLFAYLLKRLVATDETKTVRFFVYLFGSLVFFIQGGDIIYFSDASRHIGYEIADTFNDAPYLLSTAWTVYKLPFLFHIALYISVLYFIRKKYSGASNAIRDKLRGLSSLNYEGAFLITFIISVILARGGFQSIPLEPIHAQELSDHSKATLALNGSFNAVFNLLNKDKIKPVEINIPAGLDVSATVSSMYPRKTSSLPTSAEWKPNIIFIFLESWPAMYMKSYGYDKQTTPFFDELRKKSLTTLDMLAGGHRTTEGMFASLCSAQNPLGQTISQSQLQDFSYYCLPHILRDKGYQTAFFQGSNKNTSGTGAFAQLLGFTESYGKADIEYRQYKENSWGVYDQDLYRHILKDLKARRTPFLAGINTNTTHDIRLPKGVSPAFTPGKSTPRNINSLYFADAALKEFFNAVENDPGINNTLWVIVADHTAGLKTSRYNNYRIPFLIYSKDRVPAKYVNRVASQRDISPTLLDILGFTPPGYFSGKVLYKDNNPPYFAEYYHSGMLGWFEDNLFIEIPVSDPEKASCFDYISDKMLQNKISCPDNAKLGLQHALAFTTEMQSLLFEGKLNTFRK